MSPDNKPISPVVVGCPVGENLPACPRCQGWLRKLTSEKFSKLIQDGTLNPTALCDPLADRACAAYDAMATIATSK